jgi:hypothetical protein
MPVSSRQPIGGAGPTSADVDSDFVTGCLGCAVNNSRGNVAICLGICVIGGRLSHQIRQLSGRVVNKSLDFGVTAVSAGGCVDFAVVNKLACSWSQGPESNVQIQSDGSWTGSPVVVVDCIVCTLLGRSMANIYTNVKNLFRDWMRSCDAASLNYKRRLK